MNMKNAPEGARKFPIRNIFGSARNEAAPYFYSTKSLNPADAAQYKYIPNIYILDALIGNQYITPPL